MSQAITTKYLGPTDHRGSRIKATSRRGSLTIPWDDALSVAANHTAAARAAAQKWGWTGLWTGGCLPTNTGYSFVCMSLSSGSFCIEGNR